MLFQKYPVHAVPFEITGECSHPIFHAMKVIVMTKTCFHDHTLLAQLLMIDLPGMEIKDGRTFFKPVQSLQKPSRNRIRP